MKIEFEMITTRGGDGGKSSLFGGERREKSDPVFAVLGDIDELVSQLGVVRPELRSPRSGDPAVARTVAARLDGQILSIQKELQNISAVIATPVNAINKIKPLGKNEKQWISYLTSLIDGLEKVEMEYIGNIELDGFIIPGSNELCARLDLSRAVCRRAERQLVNYVQRLPAEYLRLAQNYVNRLSDALFVFARYLEQNS